MSALAAIPAVGDAAAAAKMAKKAATVGDVVRAVDKVDDVAGGVRTALKAADAASDAKAASAPIAKAIDATTQVRTNVDKVIPRRVQNVLAKRQDEIQAGAEFTSNTVSDVQQALEENGGELRPGQLGEILSGNVKSAAVGYAADKVIGNAVENMASGVMDRVRRRGGRGGDAPDVPKSTAARTQVEADSAPAARQGDRTLPPEREGLAASPERAQPTADVTPTTMTPGRSDAPAVTAATPRRSNNTEALPTRTNNNRPAAASASDTPPRTWDAQPNTKTSPAPEPTPQLTSRQPAESPSRNTRADSETGQTGADPATPNTRNRDEVNHNQPASEQNSQHKKPAPVGPEGQTTHYDEPEIAPGVVAKGNAADGHNLKVLKNGEIVRCSICGPMKVRYEEVLKNNPDLRTRMEDVEKIRSPKKKLAEARKLEHESFKKDQLANAAISQELYDALRSETPTRAIRKAVNKVPGQKVDPVYNYPVKTLEADHTVSMKRIANIDSFQDLTVENQLKVLNNPENFIGLGKSSNASKQDKSWADWEGHSMLGPIPQDVKDKMVKEEIRIAADLQDQIGQLLQEQKSY